MSSFAVRRTGHASGRLYADAHVFFRFDPAAGTFLGTQRIKGERAVLVERRLLSAVAISDQFDPNGNPTATGLRATITATRIKIEHIPDLP